MTISEPDWPPTHHYASKHVKESIWVEAPPPLSPECSRCRSQPDTHNGHFSLHSSLPGMQSNPCTTPPKTIYRAHSTLRRPLAFITGAPPPLAESLHHRWPHVPPLSSHPLPLLCWLKRKQNLMGVIWCDATNPGATNHRSLPPSSTQTPETPSRPLHICLR